MRAIDTNVLVRYYAQDDARQSAAAVALFERGGLFVPVTVVLETEWVLRARYGVTPARIAEVFAHLLALEEATVEDAEAVAVAVERLRRGFDFADALHHARCGHCSAFLTFDSRGFAARARRAGLKPQVALVE
jgi:predicted nucleic-acid-binding protein